MPQYTPYFKPGAAVTYQVSADVTGGQVLQLTGDRTVAPATADSATVVGIAGFDAGVGDSVTVFDGGIQRPLAAADITAGAKVVSAANGQVDVADEESANVLGLALAAAAEGEPVQIKFQA